MTQDCSPSLSTSTGNTGSCNLCFPKGIHIAGTEKHSAPGIESVPVCDTILAPSPHSSSPTSHRIPTGISEGNSPSPSASAGDFWPTSTDASETISASARSSVVPSSSVSFPASSDDLSEDKAPANSGVSAPNPPQDIPWGYLYIHNRRVELFKKQVEAYNLAHPTAPYTCFVHYSYRYKPKDTGHGVSRQHLPTVSGLVFLQGHSSDLQSFLKENYPQYHLVKDCSTGRSASISNRIMQSFIEAATIRPESITFLREPFIKFARSHTRLRLLSGPFRGMEGYIVRIHRDRQLVMNFGGYAVALCGVHNEDFEVVE